MSASHVTPDRLFKYLDGQRLCVGGGNWSVVVYGVFDDQERRWVQIVLDGSRLQVVTLTLTPTDGVDRAVESLTSWLADPSATDTVFAHVA